MREKVGEIITFFRENIIVKESPSKQGGDLNAVFLREGLIDKVSVVVVPILIGGKDASTLVDGASLKSVKELSKVRALKLVSVKKLKSSYINLKYKVLN